MRILENLTWLLWHALYRFLTKSAGMSLENIAPRKRYFADIIVARSQFSIYSSGASGEENLRPCSQEVKAQLPQEVVMIVWKDWLIQKCTGALWLCKMRCIFDVIMTVAIKYS